MQLPLADPTKTITTINIPDELVNQPINRRFIAQVIRGLIANRRQDTVHTKTRGQVRGGGRKPWRQKGTGRARHGSIRSPIWVGGGVVFGPQKERSHAVSLSRTVRQLARRLLLIDKIKHQAVTVVSSIPADRPKTKLMRAWLEGLKIPEGKILLITDEIQGRVLLASRNIPGVETIAKTQVNAYDLISHNHVVIEKAALEDLLDLLDRA